MLPKERGWVLSIDQASNAAGVVLWYDGRLIAQTCLLANKSSDAISVRLRTIVAGLTLFLDQHLGPEDSVKQVVFEGVKSMMVVLSIGAFLTCPRICAKLSPKQSFVYSSSWKKWAAKRGALGPVSEIKGVRALRDIGFPVDEYRILSDDVADAVLIYLTWREKR
jgi:hypothetical protein